ncbi:MAG: double zinc ribbon domain-containing protein [Mariprofundus sp.]|nr:double zinc ribbon domain-containing protein [Mariprofundus sp.]
MLVGMSELSTKLMHTLDGARHLLFPAGCLFCQLPVHDDGVCCADCMQEIRVYPHATCLRCGVVLPESMAPGPCGRCLKYAPPQQQTYALYEYHGPVREAILNWKLAGKEGAARWLVEAALPRLKELILPDDILLPMPSPLSRMQKSGQHHTANLCAWLAMATGAQRQWRLLRRIGEQPRQSSLTGSARRKNLCKAFALSADYRSLLQQRAPDASLWIIDDIFTTGSSVHYAARAMKRTGLLVNVLTLARTEQRGL